MLFTPTTVVHENKRLRATKIICAECAKTAVLRINWFANSRGVGIANEELRYVTAKFETLGWRVGASPGGHRCPECIAVKVKGSPPPAASIVPAGSITALPPRTMSREDKRIIYDKIADVWLGDGDGYKSPWTDKRIGEDLGVPFAWVIQIREEFFGTVSSNPEIDAVMEQAVKMMEELRTMGQKLLDEAEAIQKRVIEVQRAVRP